MLRYRDRCLKRLLLCFGLHQLGHWTSAQSTKSCTIAHTSEFVGSLLYVDGHFAIRPTDFTFMCEVKSATPVSFFTLAMLTPLDRP